MKKNKIIITLAGAAAMVATVATVSAFTLMGNDTPPVLESDGPGDPCRQGTPKSPHS